jgi:formate dehydrogenase subunit gamma
MTKIISINEAGYQAEAYTIASSMKAMQGALLPILHAIQEKFGFIPSETVQIIANELNLSRAEVHGVISFYHHFRDSAPGKNVIQVCKAESCQSMGADALAAHIEKKVGCKLHGTTANGQVTLEPVYCLGLCAQSPAIMINEQLHAKMTSQKFDALLAACLGEVQ